MDAGVHRGQSAVVSHPFCLRRLDRHRCLTARRSGRMWGHLFWV